MGALTTSLTRPLTRALTAALTGMGDSEVIPAVLTATAVIDSGDILVTLTSNVNLLTSDEGDPGTVGIAYSIGEGVPTSLTLDFAADESHVSGNTYEFRVPLSGLNSVGAEPGDVINIDPFISLTSPADVEIYASASGIYVTPSVYNAVYDDTAPTEGEEIALEFDYVIGPEGQELSYRHTASVDGQVGTSQAYTPDSEIIGQTLTGRVISTLGALVGFDDTAETDEVASAGPPGLPDAWYKFNTGLHEDTITPTPGKLASWEDQIGSADMSPNFVPDHSPDVAAGIITCNGKYIKETGTGTLPETGSTIGLLMRSNSNVSGRGICGGANYDTASLQQTGGTGIQLLSEGNGPATTVPVDSNFYPVIIVLAQGTNNSKIKAGSGSIVAGTCGVNPFRDGLYVGFEGHTLNDPSNISIKEIVIYKSALNNTQIAELSDYLASIP